MNILALEDKIKASYESGVTLDEAEKLASEFLAAQMHIAEDLRALDLSVRMRKAAVKAIKAAIYLDEATKSDKKPSDTFLQAKVDNNPLVSVEQRAYDEAEVELGYLQNIFNILREAHIHFRSIAKGRFE